MIVVMDRLVLLILEVQGSNLGPETVFPDSEFSYFFPALLGKCLYSNLKQITTAAFQVPSNSSFTFILPFDVT
jgi:hypothetical protein